MEKALRRPLLDPCNCKDIGKRVVLERDNAGHYASLSTCYKCVKDSAIVTGALERIRVGAGAHGGAQGTGLDMHQCGKEARRALPGVWETGASTLEWLGNKIAWNWVLNCAVKPVLSGRQGWGLRGEGPGPRVLSKRTLNDFRRAAFREIGCRVGRSYFFSSVFCADALLT